MLWAALLPTDYLKDTVVEPEIPHKFWPPFLPFLPSFVRNFASKTGNSTFACFHADDGDADFDMRLKVDLDKLEPEFYTTGWGDRTSACRFSH